MSQIRTGSFSEISNPPFFFLRMICETAKCTGLSSVRLPGVTPAERPVEHGIPPLGLTPNSPALGCSPQRKEFQLELMCHVPNGHLSPCDVNAQMVFLMGPVQDRICSLRLGSSWLGPSADVTGPLRLRNRSRGLLTVVI